MNKPKVLIVSDFPSYGKVGMAGMTPLLYYLNFDVFQLPSAWISNTFDYGSYAIHTDTKYMKKTLEIWQKLGFDFDWLVIGMIFEDEQVEIIEDFLIQRNYKPKVLLDPILGDGGRMYRGLGNTQIARAKRLMKYSNILIPNATEAALLLEKPPESWPELNHREIIEKLRGSQRSIVITSCLCDGKPAIQGYDHIKKEDFVIFYDKIERSYPGTGDLFAAALLAGQQTGESLRQSAERASNLIYKILKTQEIFDQKGGLPLEQYLPPLEREGFFKELREK